ncbi:MAG: beta-propeller fold lactonase family protein [Ruthenibacterium sp.]
MNKEWTLAVSGYSKTGQADFALYGWNGVTMRLQDAIETGENPSFLLQRGAVIYAAHELPHSVKITAWKIENHRLIQQAKTRLSGAGLCHLCDTGKFLVGSCWESGDFFAVDYDLKHLLWRVQIQGTAVAHAHCSVWVQDRLLCCDLGRDAIGVYRIDAHKPELLFRISLADGTGPRQILPLAQGRFAVIGENSNSVLLLGNQEEQYRLLDELSLNDAGSGWPGGACMTGDDMLTVPVRGTNSLVQVQIVQQKLTIHTIHKMRADWIRMTMMPQMSNFVFAAQQKQNFIEVVQISQQQGNVFPFPAPAFVLQVIENEDDNHES